jgi:flavin-binding protein dodecin
VQEKLMAVAKTVEIISSSTESIEAAIRDGIAKASETINGIEGAWVKGTKAVIRNNQVAEWRVTLKVTFIVQ